MVDEDTLILSIAEKGFGKRTPASDYRQTNRGAKGVSLMKIAPKTGKVVCVLPVREDTDLMIITRDGKIIRIESANIRQTGRSASGVKLVDIEGDDLVAAASCIPNVEEDNGNGQDNLPLQ